MTTAPHEPRHVAQLGLFNDPAVRAHFDRELSFDALRAKLAAMYQDVCERARRAAVSALPFTGMAR